jgi:competence protein ComGC
MFASFADTIAEGTVLLFIVGVVAILSVKKYLTQNADVNDTAKKATAKIATHGIAAIVKRIVK